MVVDFRKDPSHSLLYINGEIVESVDEYKYLGTIIDRKFNFNSNVQQVYKKSLTRMYYIRQLKKLNIENKIMELFYTSIVQSVLSFAIVCWYGNCSAESKDKVNRIVRKCTKLGVTNTVPLLDIYNKSVLQRSKTIINDNLHPLNCQYELLPSGRRLRSINCKTSRYAKSFIPSSIVLINKTKVNFTAITS